MRVSLKNFKQYADFSLDLPETGLVLLKGETGKGKSSIFDAIYHAVTGDADDIVPWTGEKPAVVRLDMAEMTIERSHTPTSLIVTRDGNTILDLAAQSEIYCKLGMTAQEFLAACYIRQRMEGSLLSLGAADQLRFIQKLAFGDQDPEVYKKRIAVQINGRATKIALEEQGVTYKQNSLAQAIQAAATAKAQLDQHVMPSCTVCEDEASLQASRYGLQGQHTAKKLDVEMARTLLKHEVHALRDSWAAQDALAKKQLIDLRLSIATAEGELGAMGLPWTEASADEVKAKLQLADQKLNYLAWKKKAADFVTQVRSQYPACDKSATAFLDEESERISQVINGLNEEVSTLKVKEKELASAHIPQRCPHCSGAVSVSDGQVVKSHDADVEFITSERARVKASLSELKTKLEACYVQRQDVTTLVVAGREIKKSAVEDVAIDGVVSPEDITQFKSKWVMYATMQSKLEMSVKFAKENIAKLQGQEKKINDDLVVAIQRIEKHRDIPQRDEIEKTKEKIENEMADIRDQINEIDNKMNEISEYQSAIKLVELKKKQCEDAEQQVRRFEEVVETAKKTLADRQAEWAASSRLKTISDSAAIGSTEAVIAAINQHAKSYIDKMFPHGGTSVRILSGFKTKKGEDKAKLALEIIHKGQEVKAMRPLSGGEKDRITLAFQLAMCELYRAPFLIIDEGFAGIDVENTMGICLDALKDISSEKLVIMAQHGAPEGLFDQVITL
jgi:DNA repair exonuclease SbcCD ATPase subunit